jgi:hypothetical protein
VHADESIAAVVHEAQLAAAAAAAAAAEVGDDVDDDGFLLEEETPSFVLHAEMLAVVVGGGGGGGGGGGEGGDDDAEIAEEEATTTAAAAAHGDYEVRVREAIPAVTSSTTTSADGIYIGEQRVDGGTVATILVGDEPGIVALLAVDYTASSGGGTVSGIVRRDGDYHGGGGSGDGAVGGGVRFTQDGGEGEKVRTEREREAVSVVPSVCVDMRYMWGERKMSAVLSFGRSFPNL